MDWLSYEDGIWIGAVLAITEAIKRIWRIRPRWVPLIPLAVALFIGAWLALDDPWAGWWAFTRAAVNHALRIGPLAMASYKVFRTTIEGRE